MTKRLHLSVPPDGPEGHDHEGPSETGGSFLGLAFLAGVVMFALAFAGRGGESHLADLSAKFTSTLQERVAELPRSLSSLRGDYWPDWLSANGWAAAGDDPKPAIAIVIDDLGLDEPLARQAIALPGAVTLSFLPGPSASLPLSRSARAAGHEVVLHVAMEAVDGGGSGPLALRIGMDEEELGRRLELAMSRVAGHSGVSNHLGSRFTTSRLDLTPVMRKLSERGLYFLDSRSTPESQAEAVARETGLLAGGRDVSLHNSASPFAIEQALAKLEVEARAHGSVIAIAHPNAATLAGLKSWTKELSARGFRLAPLKTVLQLRADKMQKMASQASVRS